MPKTKKYVVGQNYGDCQIVDELEVVGNSRRFVCKCLNCGKEYVTYAANIERYHKICKHKMNPDKAYDILPKNSPCHKCRDYFDDPAKCDKYAECPDWLKWFKKEWCDIKSAAEKEKLKL